MDRGIASSSRDGSQIASPDGLAFKNINNPIKKQTICVKQDDDPCHFLRLLYECLVAGGLAGLVVEAALYPIDTIKTRVQVARDGGKIIWKGLYSGLGGNLAGVLPASALFFGVYEPTKQKLLKVLPEKFSAVAHLIFALLRVEGWIQNKLRLLSDFSPPPPPKPLTHSLLLHTPARANSNPQSSPSFCYLILRCSPIAPPLTECFMTFSPHLVMMTLLMINSLTALFNVSHFFLNPLNGAFVSDSHSTIPSHGSSLKTSQLRSLKVGNDGFNYFHTFPTIHYYLLILNSLASPNLTDLKIAQLTLEVRVLDT
ncbi:hypothetical protein Bca52824_081282 [Brassica carinata]|uniref:Uncharacterized protein n=1 Tax=Brassica carinata TaxID=52824 RepID=A0A8X7TRR9_BRACI|nr:hypothetical protein Bca52824_081282 [Brassica carinata]